MTHNKITTILKPIEKISFCLFVIFITSFHNEVDRGLTPDYHFDYCDKAYEDSHYISHNFCNVLITPYFFLCEFPLFRPGSFFHPFPNLYIHHITWFMTTQPPLHKRPFVFYYLHAFLSHSTHRLLKHVSVHNPLPYSNESHLSPYRHLRITGMSLLATMDWYYKQVSHASQFHAYTD